MPDAQWDSFNKSLTLIFSEVTIWRKENMMELRCKLGLHKYHRYYWTHSVKGVTRHDCAYCDAYVTETYEGVYTNPVWATITAILVVILIVGVCVIFHGCAAQPRKYISPYESPFGEKMTPQQTEVLRLHITRECWARWQLWYYETGQAFADRAEP